jgi:hypothetical protein
MLKQLDDLTEFGWIQDNLDKLLPYKSENWKGNFVSHCLPPRFDSYCKIFPPIFIDLDYVNKPSITWDDLKDEDERTEKIVEWTLVDGGISDSGFHLEQIKWEALAKKQGLKFHSEISDYSFFRTFDSHWPRYLIGANEGTLDKKTCKNIVSALTTFTGSQLCFFEYFIMATKKLETGLLFTGHLDDVQQSFLLEPVRGSRSPNYWWPEDHSWCLCTDYDLCFTILGGTKEIIEHVLMDKELESLKVESSTRVDWHGDQINFPQ